MIVRLIAEIFMLLKEVLTYCVKSNIKQVFGQMTQIAQNTFFGAIQFQSNCLSQQPKNYPLYILYSSGIDTFCTNL
jgi:hypothetical protein